MSASAPTYTTEVALCTCNGARFVSEQLQSILKQTQAVTRISIYDDASTDDTVNLLLAAIASLDAERRATICLHINPHNVGYAANFARAIKGACEDLIFLCDQDDIWEPEKVKTMAAALADQEVDLVFSDGTVIDADGMPIGGVTVFGSYGLTPKEANGFRSEAFNWFLRRNYVNGAALAIRRKSAQDALPIPDAMPHDYWLALWSALHGGVIAIPATLYRYRQHGANTIGLGSGNALHLLLGMWRHPNAPRELELKRWQALATRISALPNSGAARAAQRKLAWLTRVVAKDRGRFRRLLSVVGSAMTGKYRAYAPPGAFQRDLISTLKR